MEAPQLSTYVLDTDTGQTYRLTATPLSLESGRVAVMAWTADGEMLLRVQGQLSSAGDRGVALYAGRPFEPFRVLVPIIPADGGRLTPAGPGLLTVRNDDRSFLLDLASGAELAELPGPPWYPGSWSADGEFVALTTGGDCGGRAKLGIWSLTAGMVEEIQGAKFGVWSPAGLSLAYVRARTDEECVAPREIQLLDLESGIERAVGRGDGITWSPDGRFLTITADAPASFSVFDLARGTSVKVTGAWFGGWLDADTLYFMGNVCGTNDVFTLNADGSDQRRLAAPLEFVASPHATPDGLWIALSELNRTLGTRFLRIVSVATGEEERFQTGAASLPYLGHSTDSRAVERSWSPDGRYVVLAVPAAKDGPCEFDPPQLTTVETG